MTDIKDGGPAFPETHVLGQQYGPEYEPGWKGRTGMTLRDWFAGMALQAFMSDPQQRINTNSKFLIAASNCYEMADAMLIARQS